MQPGAPHSPGRDGERSDQQGSAVGSRRASSVQSQLTAQAATPLPQRRRSDSRLCIEEGSWRQAAWKRHFRTPT